MGLIAKKLAIWIERYLFSPTPAQRILSFLLLPVALLYCFAVVLRRLLCRPRDFGIPVVSIGNLTVGGSGKTPFVIALGRRIPKVAVVLRGYRRQSQGVVVVSHEGKILTDVKTSGDEAMLIARSLPEATVIVAEKREEAVRKARELGCSSVLLDDGFRHCQIKKFDILLVSSKEPKNIFCLPSGPYREPRIFMRLADIVAREGIDFIRKVRIINPTKKMVLVTAISQPWRLDRYLPEVTAKFIFPDHHPFDRRELEEIVQKTQASSILTTFKDAIKMEGFGFDLSVMELELEIKEEIANHILDYIANEEKNAKKDSNCQNAA